MLCAATFVNTKLGVESRKLAFDTMTPQQDEKPMHHRADDIAPIRITREIPLWGILSFLAMLALNALSMYYGQIEQGKEIRNGNEAIKALSQKVEVLSTAISSKDTKDVEHDFLIADTRRRLDAIETEMRATRQQSQR